MTNLSNFNPSLVIWDKDDVLDFINKFHVITDATFSHLNEDTYTQKRLQPFKDYLNENGVSVSYNGDFNAEYGAYYWWYDDKTNFQSAQEIAQKMIELWIIANP